MSTQAITLPGGQGMNTSDSATSSDKTNGIEVTTAAPLPFSPTSVAVVSTTVPSEGTDCLE